MKKIICVLVMSLAVSVTMHAQLAWDSEFVQSDFNNAQTVISKTDNVKWSSGLFGLGAHLEIGSVNLFSAYEEECVIALPQVGIAEKLYFSWQGASNGTISIYQSADHNNWSQVFTTEGNTISTAKSDSVELATTTRYLKFAATGKTAAAFYSVKVTELKRIAVSTDEWPFKAGKVDDPDEQKTVSVTWTNIVAEVSSTDPHFAVSLSTVGEKNKIDQTSSLVISYSHAEAGVHSGEIVLSGEGREVRIAVSGETSKYDQSLSWAQDLTECVATDQLSFNAFATSSLAVEYISSDSSVAYVEGSSLVIVRSGAVEITATQPGNYKFNAAESIQKSLVIHKADPMVGALAGDLTYGQELKEAQIEETYGLVPGVFTWYGIDGDSVLNAGDYALELLFTPADTGKYNTKIVPVALRVNKAVQTITWEEQATDLVVGQEISSTAVLSSGLPITYAYTICLLSIENGVIVAENEGDVTVIAYHPGNENYLPTTVIMQDFHIEAAAITTNVSSLSADEQQKAEKFLHEGKVYLYYNGSTYDAEGRRVE